MNIEDFNFSKIEKKQALFILEALYKSSEDNALNCSLEILNQKNIAPWSEVLNALAPLNLSVISKYLLSLAHKSADCAKIIKTELEFDIFQNEYQYILDLFYPQWQYDNPGKVLCEILIFCDSFKVPRVKLRLLLEMAKYADAFDSNDLQIIFDVHGEVEKTLDQMPSSILEQTDGGWFYARGIEDLREFVESW